MYMPCRICLFVRRRIAVFINVQEQLMLFGLAISFGYSFIAARNLEPSENMKKVTEEHMLMMAV
jgi:hypothetical protein